MRRALWVLLRVAVYTLGASLEMCLPASRQGAVAVSWNGSVLVVAGSRAPKCGPNNITHLDDILLGPVVWRTLTHMGADNARTHHAACVSQDTLFVLGGFGGAAGSDPWRNQTVDHPLATVIAVDLTNPAVKPQNCAPLPAGPMTNFGAAGIPGTRDLIIAGGYVYADAALGRHTTASAWRYYSGNNSWSPLPSMKQDRAGIGFVLSHGMLYALGGFSGPNHGFVVLDSVEIWDLTSRSWSAGPSLPSPAAQSKAVLGNNGRILLVGGHNATADICYNASTTVLLPSVIALNGATWKKVAEIPVPRGFLAAAVASGTMYTIGGYDGRMSAHADSLLVQAMDLKTYAWDSCDTQATDQNT